MPASICRPGSPLATHIAVGDRDGVTRGSVPFCAVENRLLHFDPQRIFRAGSAKLCSICDEKGVIIGSLRIEETSMSLDNGIHTFKGVAYGRVDRGPQPVSVAAATARLERRPRGSSLSRPRLAIAGPSVAPASA